MNSLQTLSDSNQTRAIEGSFNSFKHFAEHFSDTDWRMFTREAGCHLGKWPHNCQYISYSENPPGPPPPPLRLYTKDIHKWHTTPLAEKISGLIPKWGGGRLKPWPSRMLIISAQGLMEAFRGGILPTKTGYFPSSPQKKLLDPLAPQLLLPNHSQFTPKTLQKNRAAPHWMVLIAP